MPDFLVSNFGFRGSIFGRGACAVAQMTSCGRSPNKPVGMNVQFNYYQINVDLSRPEFQPKFAQVMRVHSSEASF
jgi:hypothetical protein